MGADGIHPAVRHEHDLLGAVQHQRAGREHHSGPPGPQEPQAVGDPRLGVGVHRAGGLVEHQHRRVDVQRTGKSHPLALSAGQGAATLGQNRLRGIGDTRGQGLAQYVQDVCALGSLECCLDRDGSAGRYVEQVAHRARQQYRVLVLHEHRRAGGVQRQVVQRDTTQQYRRVVGLCLGAVAAQAVRQQATRVGVAADHCREGAGRYLQAGERVDQVAGRHLCL